jgi:hypothetical protein
MFRVTLVVASLVVAPLFTAGCEREPPAVALGKKLIELRSKRTAKLDALYAVYGKGEVTGRMAKDVRREAARLDAEASAEEDAPDAEDRNKDAKRLASSMLKVMGNAAEELDRATFDLNCETLGRGERPALYSEKSKLFFEGAEAKKGCREVAELSVEIAAGEGELKKLEAGGAGG